MGVLKSLALSLFGFLLFLSLIIYAPVHLVNSTVLNPDYIVREMNKVQVSTIANDMLEEDPEQDFPLELQEALVSTAKEVEPVVKEQLDSAIHSISDYLRGRKDDPELSQLLRNTFISASFVSSVLDKIDLATVLDSALPEEMPAEFADAVDKVIAAQGDELKARVAAASDPIFAYLLSETEDVDIAVVLRDTVLDSDFILSLVDELDISQLVSEYINQQIEDLVPEGVVIPTDTLADAIATLEPTIEEALRDAVDPMLDYLLGLSDSFSVTISLSPVIDDIRDVLRQAVLDTVPTEWVSLPQQEREQRINEFLDEATGAIPANIELDEVIFGTGVQEQIASSLDDVNQSLAEARVDISEAISKAEDNLVEARTYVGYFLTGYYILLAVIVVLILAIIALHHRVKGASRHLGITALVCGTIELVGLLVLKYFALANMVEVDIPQAFQDLPEQMLNDFTAPLMTLSIGLIVVGLILIVVSIFYPRFRGKSSETES
ncbi:MAG: hypothetical protein ISS55_01935 [Dehalococcoidales bacterium]|nr:hypothetical protein [Dehalococcoidales bacterium]